MRRLCGVWGALMRALPHIDLVLMRGVGVFACAACAALGALSCGRCRTVMGVCAFGYLHAPLVRRLGRSHADTAALRWVRARLRRLCCVLDI